MVRKAIQIATSRANLYALCDDGRIYQLIESQSQWTPVAAIPQDASQTSIRTISKTTARRSMA
jgi:hypothetical protein